MHQVNSTSKSTSSITSGGNEVLRSIHHRTDETSIFEASNVKAQHIPRPSECFVSQVFTTNPDLEQVSTSASFRSLKMKRDIFEIATETHSPGQEASRLMASTARGPADLKTTLRAR